ncbi:hypothetical protein [Aquimarina intermedia]|uniref:Uncharacterized protein n=1 Tax=Aquimarina intermedia TaxID=350814 RepID=A0A5S5C5E6_9FLAO|nr:hypothetical protein [Aquimarina intermedia]TYP73550.1 hypothetical protein BD809_105137 [Aquimarina intermedia]
MKTRFLNIDNAKVLCKKEQQLINGGSSSSECLFTGCFDNFVGFEGGPCALETPTPQSCTGIVRNGECCIF